MKDTYKNKDLLVGIICAILFPLIYIIGRLMIYWLG